ncbi:alpha/beta hydrolase [Jannaschia marina]|uniref:alpha/beta hydrolase n=1 Tax=Jannaschia marina TaxID=2741674 RepID=UPI0015CCCB8F|nr:alpha/beta hydrolase [Jannaschia marina]
MPLVFSRRRFVRGSVTDGISDRITHGRVDRAGGTIRLSLQRPDDWIDAIRAQSGDGTILLTVHGYNTPQPRFLARLLDLEGRLRDAGFNGALVGFDWPSVKGALRYTTDRATATTTARSLVDHGIAPLRHHLPGHRLHLMAHSMGCYVTLHALAQFGEGLGERWFDQVLFTACDVDHRMMRKGQPGARLLANRAARFTHYYNRLDEVLAVPGRVIHRGRARAGSTA